jgi:membrane protein required for colicin V production
MGSLDAILSGVVLLSCVVGLWRGVIRETLALLAWIIGFVLSSNYANFFASYLPPTWNENLRLLAAWVLVFVAVLLCMNLLSMLMHRLVTVVGLGVLDRLMGGLFGLLRGGIALMAVSVLVGLTPAKTAWMWKNSWMAQLADQGVLFFKPIMPSPLERLVS